MKKFFLFIIFVAAVAVAYSVLSDPEKRERILGTIEDSTGVDLESGAEKAMEGAGKAVGDAAGRMFEDLGDALTDPEFHRSLERFGKDSLEKLDEFELQSLKDELELESGQTQRDYQTVLEKYLGEADDS